MLVIAEVLLFPGLWRPFSCGMLNKLVASWIRVPLRAHLVQQNLSDYGV